ncbi:CcmD family protein [candidate division KSB1 bacterium]|jgi:CcmD family protein|nr:CcmD family protein [candidate division KSB1 bacterium]
MRKIILFIITLFLAIPLILEAQVPRLVHYEGILSDDDGTPFTGTTDLQFSIFNSLKSEKPLWSEVHKNIEISDGSYEVFLGSKNPLNLSYYEYFLQVTAENVKSDNSRTMIVGSGYNFRLKFLFAAYTIVWVALSIYLFSISRRQKKLIADLETLAKVK